MSCILMPSMEDAIIQLRSMDRRVIHRSALKVMAACKEQPSPHSLADLLSWEHCTAAGHVLAAPFDHNQKFCPSVSLLPPALEAGAAAHLLCSLSRPVEQLAGSCHA